MSSEPVLDSGRLEVVEVTTGRLGVTGCDERDQRIAALEAERDALKAELTRVRDLAEKDRAAFADTLCAYRTALRETREALQEIICECSENIGCNHQDADDGSDDCTDIDDCIGCTISTIASDILAKYAALAEGGDRG